MMSEMTVQAHPDTASLPKAFARLVAFHDGLTGLNNLQYLAHRFSPAMSVSCGLQKRLVLFIDLDGFGELVACNGRAIAEEVLCEFARILREVVGFEGNVYRIGDEDFVAELFTEDPECATQVVTEVRRQFAALSDLPTLGVGSGWASFPEEGISMASLLRLAHQRLDEEKHSRGSEPRV